MDMEIGSWDEKWPCVIVFECSKASKLECFISKFASCKVAQSDSKAGIFMMFVILLIGV